MARLLWQQFSKSCGADRTVHAEEDLLELVKLVFDTDQTQELVEFLEKCYAGAWNVPPHLSLLMLHEIRRRNVPISDAALYFLAREAKVQVDGVA